MSAFFYTWHFFFDVLTSVFYSREVYAYPDKPPYPGTVISIKKYISKKDLDKQMAWVLFHFQSCSFCKVHWPCARRVPRAVVSPKQAALGNLTISYTRPNFLEPKMLNMGPVFESPGALFKIYFS